MRMECPNCGGRDFRVQLPAVFAWDGEQAVLGPEDLRADEFPVGDTAVVLCSCNWEGRVEDLISCQVNPSSLTQHEVHERYGSRDCQCADCRMRR